MNLVVDAHTHTVASTHAYSTILENVEYAKKNGMKAIGFTDHAHRMADGAHRYHFWNLRKLPREINGVIVLKGAEANIMNDEGHLDIEEFDRDYGGLDIIISSIHSSCMKSVSKEYHTNAYINAIKNPYTDIIGHPDDHKYEYDVEMVVKAAKEYGKALEVNNSSTSIGRADLYVVEKMLNFCKELGVFISCGTDAHFALDVGVFDNVTAILNKVNFPEELVLNTSVEKMEKFLAREKNIKVTKPEE